MKTCEELRWWMELRKPIILPYDPLHAHAHAQRGKIELSTGGFSQKQ